MTVYYLNNDKNMTMSFTLKKEIKCITIDLANKIINSLSELKDKKETFGKICIPDFTYGINENIVWYESDYIKGDIIKSEDLDVVWNECVLRKDTFTLMNYHRENYIRCFNSRKIYYIDLNDCRHAPFEERMEKWYKHT